MRIEDAIAAIEEHKIHHGISCETGNHYNLCMALDMGIAALKYMKEINRPRLALDESSCRFNNGKVLWVHNDVYERFVNNPDGVFIESPCLAPLKVMVCKEEGNNE